MIDIGWSRQAGKLRWFTLHPKGLGDRKTAFGLAMLDSRGPFPKLFQVWRLWHFLAVFQAFAAVAHITLLIDFTIILLLSLFLLGKIESLLISSCASELLYLFLNHR